MIEEHPPTEALWISPCGFEYRKHCTGWYLYSKRLPHHWNGAQKMDVLTAEMLNALSVPLDPASPGLTDAIDRAIIDAEFAAYALSDPIKRKTASESKFQAIKDAQQLATANAQLYRMGQSMYDEVQRLKRQTHAMRQAFRTSVTDGTAGVYEMRFKFRSLAEMQGADHAWAKDE